jgi:cation:H+ antiporter
VPDEVIALSLMAVGTSLPEFATTLAACRKGETDLAIGNVAGSNVFNLLLVLGICATAFDLPVSDVMAQTDFPAMTLAAVLAFPVLSRSGRINRFQGALLVFLYLIYTVWIFTHARAMVPL